MSQASDRAERFATHLEPLQGALEAFCRRGLFNPSDVEDVLQASVLRAFRDFDMYAEGTNFRAWIFKYVRFEVLNCNRRHQRSPESLPATGESAEQPVVPFVEEPDYEHLLAAPEAVLENCEDELAAAVRELPETEREVLLLRAIGEFAYPELFIQPCDWSSDPALN